jgi:hypothetical protein
MKASAIHNVIDMRTGLVHPRAHWDGRAIHPKESAHIVRNRTRWIEGLIPEVTWLGWNEPRRARAVDLRLGVESRGPASDARASLNEYRNATAHMRRYYPESRRAALSFLLELWIRRPEWSSWTYTLLFEAVPYLRNRV